MLSQLLYPVYKTKYTSASVLFNTPLYLRDILELKKKVNKLRDPAQFKKYVGTGSERGHHEGLYAIAKIIEKYKYTDSLSCKNILFGAEGKIHILNEFRKCSEHSSHHLNDLMYLFTETSKILLNSQLPFSVSSSTEMHERVVSECQNLSTGMFHNLHPCVKQLLTVYLLLDYFVRSTRGTDMLQNKKKGDKHAWDTEMTNRRILASDILGTVLSNEREIAMVHTRDVTFFVFNTTIVFLGSMDLLSVRQMALENFNIHYLFATTSCITKESKFITLLSEFREAVYNDIIKYGNKAYDAVKSIEAASTVIMLERHTYISDISYIKSTKESICQIYGYEYDKDDFLPLWYKIMCKMPTDMIAEVSGMVKSFGSCYIDDNEGIEVQYDRVQTKMPLNKETILMVTATHMYRWVKEYFRVESKYPPLIIPDTKEFDILRMACSSGKWIDDFANDISRNTLPIRLWYRVHHAQTFSFDTSDTPYPFISDKRVGPNINDLQRSSDGETCLGMRKQRKDKKKAILWYLKDTKFKVEYPDFRKKLSRGDYSMLSNESCLYRAKEREIKIKGRYFACLSPYLRHWLGEVRENFTKYLQYVPGQMLIRSYTEKAQIIDYLSKPVELDADYVMVIIVFDFSGWNTRFNVDNTTNMFMRFDEAFNGEYYSNAHEILEELKFYYPRGEELVKWDGQFGGIEGQRQYEWTVFTLAMVDYAIATLGYTGTTYGSGDNTICRIKIQKSTLTEQYMENPDDMVYDIKKQFSKVFEECGLVEKTEESYMADNVAIFLKEIYVEGVKMPMGVKQVTRMSIESQIMIPTIQDSVSSIWSCAVSAIGSCYMYREIYSLAVLHTIMALCHYRGDKEDIDECLKNPHSLAPMLIAGTPYGFPSCMILQEMMCRGMSDSIVNRTSVLQRLCEYNPQSLQYTTNIITQNIMKNPDWRLVCEDPYSIPFIKPTTANSIIRKEIHKYLTRYTENPEVIELLNWNSEEIRKEVVAILSSPTVKPLKLVAESYGNSVCGLVDEFISKIEQESTLRGSMRDQEFRKLVGKVRIADSRLYDHWIEVTTGTKEYHSAKESFSIPKIWNQIDPFLIISTIRDGAWGNHAGDITEPNPFDMYSYHCYHNKVITKDNNSNFDIYRTGELSKPNYISHLSICTKGTNYFIGYSTSEKIKTARDNTVLQPRGMKKICRLLELRSYVLPSNTTWALILKDLVSMYGVDVGYKTVDKIIRHEGGSIDHRLRCRGFEHEMRLNICRNIPSNYEFSTDNFRLTRESGNSYNINFLYTYVCLMANLTTIYTETQHKQPFIHLYTTLRYKWLGTSIREISDLKLDTVVPRKMTINHPKFPSILIDRKMGKDFNDKIQKSLYKSIESNDKEMVIHEYYQGYLHEHQSQIQGKIEERHLVATYSYMIFKNAILGSKYCRTAQVEYGWKEVAEKLYDLNNIPMYDKGEMNKSEVMISSMYDILTPPLIDISHKITMMKRDEDRLYYMFDDLCSTIEVNNTLLYPLCIKIVSYDLVGLFAHAIKREKKRELRPKSHYSPRSLYKDIINIFKGDIIDFATFKRNYNIHSLPDVRSGCNPTVLRTIVNMLYLRGVHENVLYTQAYANSNFDKLEAIISAMMLGKAIDDDYEDVRYYVSSLLFHKAITGDPDINGNNIKAVSVAKSIGQVIANLDYLSKDTLPRFVEKNVEVSVYQKQLRMFKKKFKGLVSLLYDIDTEELVGMSSDRLPIFISLCKDEETVNKLIDGALEYIEELSDRYKVKMINMNYSEVRNKLTNCRLVETSLAEHYSQMYAIDPKNFLTFVTDQIWYNKQQYLSKAKSKTSEEENDVSSDDNDLTKITLEQYNPKPHRTLYLSVLSQDFKVPNIVSSMTSHSKRQTLLDLDECKDVIRYDPSSTTTRCINMTVYRGNPGLKSYSPSQMHRGYSTGATADSKLSNIFSSINLSQFVKRNDYRLKALCLADGAGGFTKYIHDAYPTSTVIYSSMIDNKTFKSSKLPIGICDENEYMYPRIHVVSSDVLRIDMRLLDDCNHVMNSVKETKLKMDVITMDAELRGEDAELLMLHYQHRLLSTTSMFACKLLRKGGTLIMKTINISDYLIQQNITILTEMYMSVNIMKPIGSHVDNDEVYIVCTKYKGYHEVKNTHFYRSLRHYYNLQDYDYLSKVMNIIVPESIKQNCRRTIKKKEEMHEKYFLKIINDHGRLKNVFSSCLRYAPYDCYLIRTMDDDCITSLIEYTGIKDYHIRRCAFYEIDNVIKNTLQEMVNNYRNVLQDEKNAHTKYLNWIRYKRKYKEIEKAEKWHKKKIRTMMMRSDYREVIVYYKERGIRLPLDILNIAQKLLYSVCILTCFSSLAESVLHDDDTVNMTPNICLDASLASFCTLIDTVDVSIKVKLKENDEYLIESFALPTQQLLSTLTLGEASINIKDVFNKSYQMALRLLGKCSSVAIGETYYDLKQRQPLTRKEARSQWDLLCNHMPPIMSSMDNVNKRRRDIMNYLNTYEPETLLF